MSAYWDWVASGGQDETLGPSTWGNEDLDAYGTWGDPNEWVIPFDIRLQDIASSIASIPKGLWNAVKGFVSNDSGDVDWGKLVTLGGAVLPLLQGSSNRPVGYQGGIPQYTAVREQVPQTYDPNRRPGSGGQRYFSDVSYVPKSGTGPVGSLNLPASASSVEDLYQQVLNRPAGEEGQAYWSQKFGEEISPAEIREFTAAAQPELLRTQAQGLAALNAANPLNAAPPAYQPSAPPPATAQPTPAYNEAYSGENVLKTVREMLNAPRMAKGGIVGLQDGGFVFPADVVSGFGNGSTDAGLAFLEGKGAVPIRGRGDGMSDSIRTTINGRQPAAVANGEAYLPPQRVKEMGGAEKLYAMMDKIRKDRTGTTKQGRQINPNQYV